MRCVRCGTELPGGAKFCPECGEKQGPSRRAIFSDREIADIRAHFETDEYLSELRDMARDGLSIERRHLAVMFVDVSGFTRMSSVISREQLRLVMHDVYSVMTEGITKFGGYIDKFFGDEAMALFGAPIALEHPCDRAITVASEIAIGLGGVNYRFRDILPAPLSIHAGIAFGEVEAGRFGDSRELQYTVLGEAVNLAKRLTDAAPAGAVFVCEQTRDRALERFEFEGLGELQLEGIDMPTRVFRARGPRAARTEHPRFGRLDAPMIGRNAELGKLKSAFESLLRCYPDPKPCEPGERAYRDVSRVVGVAGEAGVGKSRLKREFKRHLRALLGDDGFTWLAGSAWTIGQTPLYWSLKATISSGAGFDMTGSQQAIRDRLLKLSVLESDKEEVLPYLFHLFGFEDEKGHLAQLDAKTIKENLWFAVRCLYGRWAEIKPTVLVFEDMQWADDGSVDFVDYLSDFVSDFPILVILLYRPEFTPSFARAKGVLFTQVRLSPLSSSAERELLDSYIHPGAREQVFVRKLLEYSEGNPLFLEELLHLMCEQGKLEQHDGMLRLTQDVEKMPLPTRLSEVLSDRIDTLSKRDKRVAYCAAVIGRAFPYSLLADVYDSLGGVEDVSDSLDALVKRDIIFKKPGSSEPEYVFRHALIREILNRRLMESLRRELCRLVAVRVEELYGDRIEEFYGMLSSHWELAGEASRATRYSALWGIYNLRRQRHLSAQEAFERYGRLSKDLTEKLLSPEEQEEVLVSRIEVLQFLGRYEESFELCHALLSSAGEDPARRALALSKEAKSRLFMGDYDRSLALAREALKNARAGGAAKTEGDALNIMGNVFSCRGNVDEALKSYDESVAIARRLNDRFLTAGLLNNIGLVYRRRGEYDEALRHFEESLHIGREISDRSRMGHCLNNIGVVYFAQGNFDSALRYYLPSLSIKRELGDRRGVATTLHNIGEIYSIRGKHDEALKSLSEALSISRQLGDRAGISFTLSGIGNVFAETNRWDEAQKHASEAERISREIGELRALVESLIVLSNVSISAGDWDAGLKQAQEARRISEQNEPEAAINCHLALSQAHLSMVRWFDQRRSGQKPPLSRDEALREAISHAQQAKELAQNKGMKAYAKKADDILTNIGALSA